MPAKQNELARAFEAHRSGNLAAAERQYRAILRSQPDNPDLLYLLGMLSMDTERAANAAGFFDRAIRAARSKKRRIDPEWLLALGAARQRNEDSEAALEAYEQALAAAPDSVDAMFCRATALQDLQRTDDAIDAYKNLLDRAPRHAEAAYNFGLMLRDVGKPTNAVMALRKAVLLKPDYAEAYAALAPVLEDVGWTEDAIEIYRRAVELTPGDTALAASYSRCLMQANMVEEGERVLRVALTSDPDSFQLLSQLAVLRMFQNDRAETVRLARRVLAGTDSFPAAHATLAEADAEGDHEAAIREIDEILQQGELEKEPEAALEFACARRPEYLQRYEEAYDHYDRGNRLRRDGLAERGVGYDR
jgi:tetratricopeptide (TPR) repeat protein